MRGLLPADVARLNAARRDGERELRRVRLVLLAQVERLRDFFARPSVQRALEAARTTYGEHPALVARMEAAGVELDREMGRPT